MAIKFCKINDPYGCLSNFFLAPFVHNGNLFQTSEHFYQACKFENSTEHFRKVVEAQTPMTAAKLGRTKGWPIRPNWDSVKDDYMRQAIKLKFTLNKWLGQLLMETGDQELIERTDRDPYWGDGPDGKGQNKLGKLLMELRTELNKNKITELTLSL